MNSSESFSFSDSDYFLDYENDDGEGIEKVFQFWIEGVLTPVVSLFGVLGTNIYQEFLKINAEARATFINLKGCFKPLGLIKFLISA